MTEFVALYTTSDAVSNARMVALSDGPSLVGDVARRIVAQRTPEAAQYLEPKSKNGNGHKRRPHPNRN